MLHYFYGCAVLVSQFFSKYLQIVLLFALQIRFLDSVIHEQFDDEISKVSLESLEE